MKKKDRGWSLSRDNSSEALEAVQHELDEVQVNAQHSLDAIDAAFLGEYDRLKRAVSDEAVFNDTDIEHVIALQLSRGVLVRILREESLHDVKRLVELLDEVIAMRKSEQGRIAAERLEDEENAIVKMHYPMDDFLDPQEVRERAQHFENQLVAQRHRIEEANFLFDVPPTTSALKYLCRDDVSNSGAESNPTLESLIKNFWFSAEYPSIEIPSYDLAMDSLWGSLSDEVRIGILGDIQRTVVMWQIASPAIQHPSRPGVLNALLWGLQFSLDVDREKTLARSTIHKTVNNLRGAWSIIHACDAGAMLWAARVLASGGVGDSALDAMLGFASDPGWSGKNGPKGPADKEVDQWVCSACSCVYRPGDSEHDSLGAEQVGRTIDDLDSTAFTENGRIVKGLPDRAQEWNRLMCNADNRGSPCWWRGGVLMPTFKTTSN